jgi:hypothetical protein
MTRFVLDTDIVSLFGKREKCHYDYEKSSRSIVAFPCGVR